MTRISMIAAAMLLAAAPAAAQTTPYAFNTTGSSGVNGAYGNALTFNSTTDPTLKVKVTAWQSNQQTNDITSAYLGAYGTGLGVTGLGDQSGGGEYHQVDNVGGYTDFLLLQFSRAVTLTSATLNLYKMSGVGLDSDAAFWNANILQPSSWNANIDLSAYDTVPSLWSDAPGAAAAGPRPIAGVGASNYWLLGAAFLPTNDRDDGFKISQISVTEHIAGAVPEPGTWAMMILGFGAIGASLRRTRRSAFAALRTA